MKNKGNLIGIIIGIIISVAGTAAGLQSDDIKAGICGVSIAPAPAPVQGVKGVTGVTAPTVSGQ